MELKNSFKKYVTWLIVIALTGCGGGDPSISVLPSTDSFEQEGNEITAKMDILWVIDNSGSMAPYQAKLQAEFQSFITNFVDNGYDYRMATIATDAWYTILFGYDYADQTGSQVNTDNGGITCSPSALVSSKFFDGNTPTPPLDYSIISSEDESIDFSLDPANIGNADNIVEIFRNNVGIGDLGCGAESGLESIRVAMENPDNLPKGFPRPDAHLAIIVVTDEEDFNPDGIIDEVTYPNRGDYSIAAYDTYLQSIASDTYGYSLHTIALLEGQKASPPASCYQDTDDDPGTPDQLILHPASSEGLRYIELAELSGGIVSSICDPFADTLQNIAQTIIERTVEFPLTDTPANPNLLQVSVKNPGQENFTIVPQAAENGWSYNASANSIVFSGTAIPVQGSEIKILYDPDSL